jgi:hypothetical protein
MAWIVDHQLAVTIVLVGLAPLAVLAVLATASRWEPSTGRHARGVHRGTAAEVRRHRAGGRTLTRPGEASVRLDRTATTHVLDLTSATSVRNRAALRYEETGPLGDLDTILGPRPIGASA